MEAVHVHGNLCNKPTVSMKFFMTLALTATLACASCAREPLPERPKILGVAHAAFFTEDLDSSRRFFKEFLGFDEPIVMPGKEGGIAFTVIKINDRQFVELFPEREQGARRMYHFAIETDDAEAMRRYLESKGYEVPATTPKGRTGNSNYFVTDPNGNICEIVQYEPDGMTVADFGQHLPDTRIATRMSHVGIMTPDPEAALAFYTGVLGFREVWRGGPDPEKVKWIHLQVPDGDNTIELMLYDSEPSWEKLGSMNHICLEVDDINAAKAALDSREMPATNYPPTDPKVGINRKRQINYYTLDATRVEIMERETVDGQPAPSSTGEPMRYLPQKQE